MSIETYYDKNDIRRLAMAVESAVLQSLLAAGNEPAQEEKWRKHADKLELKFKNQFGRHYSYFIYEVN